MRTKEEVLEGRNYVEFLEDCFNDFKFFAEELLELTDCGGIQDFHLEWVRLMEDYRFVMIQAPSGFAKTTIFEAYAVWIAWRYRNKKIMIIANTDDRAKTILREISDFINKNEIIADLKPQNYRDTWNTQELKTSNGCRIFCKPYTPNMRGERSDFTLVDEADAETYRNTKIFQEHVISRLNPQSKVALLSTPDSTTGLMCYLLDTDKKALWKFKRYEAIIDCKVKGDLTTGESIWPQRFSMSELMIKKDAMGESAFRKIYMCDVKAEAEESIFKLRYIMDCYNKDYHFMTRCDEDSFIVLGCDFAYSDSPKADYDCFIVIEKKDNFFIIRHIEMYKGVTSPVKVSRIVDLYNQYHPQVVICDSGNIGSTAIDDLYGRGLAVVAQKFSSSERKDLILVGKNIIENKKLIIPRDPEDDNAIELTNILTEQLLGFVKKDTEANKGLIDSTAAHDDIAMALFMALKEAANQITDSFY